MMFSVGTGRKTWASLQVITLIRSEIGVIGHYEANADSLECSAEDFPAIQTRSVEALDLEPPLQKLPYRRCGSRFQRRVPVAPCRFGISVAPVQIGQYRGP